MSGRRGYVAVETGGALPALTAPTHPAQGAPSPAGTTSVSLTWTHATAPASGVTYSLTATDTSTGSAVTPSSGSGLGPYVLPTSNGQEIVVTLLCTRTTDGQTARSLPYYVAVEASPALSWAAPSTGTAAAGQTSATITWATPAGGTEPYTYGSPSVVYDSQGASTTASLSTSGAGAGTTTVSGLVNGQVVVLSRTVTDAASATVTVQGAAAIAASAATVTPGTAPAGQSLAAGTASVTIGTWGSPSGGTGPYTYAVTELTGGGTTITGSGLGPYTATGLTDGQTYAFLMTVTDSLSAKGYSVVTISVAAGSGLGAWTVVSECDFTDADWTALSSTDATSSTSAWQHTLYAADGTTPRAYVSNNSAQARTLSLSPSGSGLVLVNGLSTSTPNITVWPAGWTPLMSGSRRDAWMIEAVVEGEEPAGSGAFIHTLGIVASQAATPLAGLRVTNTGSNALISATSYISAFDSTAVRTVTAGASRLWRASVQMTIADFRRHWIFVAEGATDYRDPGSGMRVQTQSASTTLTPVAGENTTSAAWGATTISGRTKFTMYHDGSATSGSAVRLRKLRLLRMPLGSL